MEMDKTTVTLDLIIESGFRVGLWILFLCLDKVTPVIRHIDEDELWMYRYPSVESYFPKRYLYVAMILVPCLIYVGQWLIYKSDRSIIADIISSAYGLTLAYCLNGLTTAILKVSVGRPRPNFYFRCFPEGYGTDIDNCDGEYHGQMDGRKSFPSAHSSFAFTCVVYMSLYLVDQLELHRPRFLKGIIITLISLLFMTAVVVGASRTADYHHHYSDVVGGGILGATIAYLLYHAFSEKNENLRNNIVKIVSGQD